MTGYLIDATMSTEEESLNCLASHPFISFNKFHIRIHY